MKAWLLGWGFVQLGLGCSPSITGAGTDGGAGSGGSESGAGGSTSSTGGNTSSTGGNTSSTGGSGGSGMPQAARAGLLLQIRPGNTPGKACNVTPLTKTVPDQDPVAVEGPTTDNPGIRLSDGELNSSIRCGVSEGPDFDVDAAVVSGSTSFQIFGGQVSAGSTGIATISVYTPETGLLASTLDTPCTIDVGTGALQVASGAIWASFDCPSIEMPPATACAASGVFIFENCTE